MFMWFGFLGVSGTAVAALQYVISQPFNLLAWFMLVDFAVSFAVVCVTTAAHIPAALVTRIPAAHPLIGISCLQH